jgi:hypothetical protein
MLGCSNRCRPRNATDLQGYSDRARKLRSSGHDCRNSRVPARANRCRNFSGLLRQALPRRLARVNRFRRVSGERNQCQTHGEEATDALESIHRTALSRSSHPRPERDARRRVPPLVPRLSASRGFVPTRVSGMSTPQDCTLSSLAEVESLDERSRPGVESRSPCCPMWRLISVKLHRDLLLPCPDKLLKRCQNLSIKFQSDLRKFTDLVDGWS